MDDIDFLPEAYRKKCQQRHWIMRRIQFSVFAACILIVAIGYDQHSIRNQRVRVLPKLHHQVTTLENSKIQHENVKQKLSEATFRREQLYLPLLRISRSRMIGQVLSQLPDGTTLNSLNLVTQPEVWVGASISVPKDIDRKHAEMDRLVDVASNSQLKLTVVGSARSMEQINLLEKRLKATCLFANIKLQETRQNGNRVDFSLMATAINPYHQLEKQDLESCTESDAQTANSSDYSIR